MESGIALCKRENNDCPKKDNCLRYTQITGEYDFVNFPYIIDTSNGFNCFWNNGNNTIVDNNNNQNTDTGNSNG